MAPPRPRFARVAMICTTLIAAAGYVLIVSNSAKLEKAVALNEHGYSEAARLELIDLIYGPTSSLMLDTDKKIAALHLLGQISFRK